MKTKVKKKKTISREVILDDENLPSSEENESFEAAMRFWRDMMLEEYIDLLGDFGSLESELFEKKKEEAIKPIYLIRYE